MQLKKLNKLNKLNKLWEFLSWHSKNSCSLNRVLFSIKYKESQNICLPYAWLRNLELTVSLFNLKFNRPQTFLKKKWNTETRKTKKQESCKHSLKRIDASSPKMECNSLQCAANSGHLEKGEFLSSHTLHWSTEKLPLNLYFYITARGCLKLTTPSRSKLKMENHAFSYERQVKQLLWRDSEGQAPSPCGLVELQKLKKWKRCLVDK